MAKFVVPTDCQGYCKHGHIVQYGGEVSVLGSIDVDAQTGTILVPKTKEITQMQELAHAIAAHFAVGQRMSCPLEDASQSTDLESGLVNGERMGSGLSGLVDGERMGNGSEADIEHKLLIADWQTSCQLTTSSRLIANPLPSADRLPPGDYNLLLEGLPCSSTSF